MALEKPVLISLNLWRGWARSPCGPRASYLGVKTTSICCFQPCNGIILIYCTIAPSQKWHYIFTTTVKSLNIGCDWCWPDSVRVMYMKCCGSADGGWISLLRDSSSLWAGLFIL